MDDSIIKKEDYPLLLDNGKILNSVMQEGMKYASAGMTLIELDSFIYDNIIKNKARPACLNYKGYGTIPYPFSTCISVNNTVVHGVPYEYSLKDGDILTIDCAIEKGGVYVDKAVAFGIGTLSEEASRINMSVHNALEYAIKQAYIGNRIGDISSVIDKTIKSFGFKTCHHFMGHGIGYKFHTEPEVPNLGLRGTGPKLIEGMCIAIEPIALANYGEKCLAEEADDGWTIYNLCGLASHCEDTIYVSKDGPVIVTR